MIVTLSLRKSLQAPLDVRMLTCDHLHNKDRDAICRLSLSLDNQCVTVGELFRVESSEAGSSMQVVFEGECQTLDYLATAQSFGELVVRGSTGDWAGRNMRGGRLTIHGNTGDFLGSGMRGGKILANGNAGSFVGAPARGERTGMRGGQIAIDGNAGNLLAYRLRRGWILVSGEIGDGCGQEMIAGTVVSHIISSKHLGMGMRRGTLLMAQPADEEFLQEQNLFFSRPQLAHDVNVRLVQQHLRQEFAQLPSTFSQTLAMQLQWSPNAWLRRIGDLSVSGFGELLWPNL